MLLMYGVKASELSRPVQFSSYLYSALRNGLMPTFDALPAVQHPLAQEGEARAAEHLAF